MRVCPKCGHIDPPHWKNVRYSYYIEACTAENFGLLYPELNKVLIVAGVCDDKYYCYRLTKNRRWVERKAKIDFLKPGDWRDGTEAHQTKKFKDWHFNNKDWNKIHPNQTKLVFFMEAPK